MFTHDNKQSMNEVNEIDESINEISTLPCLADQKENKIPDIIFTEKAKEFFLRASPAQNEGEVGQGLIGIFWLGKNEENESVFYADLLPAFNKNDGRLIQDKNGIPYKIGEHAYTNEPLGGNSGRNHEQFKEIIAERIKNAIKVNDQKILKQYEGIYTISDKNEIIFDNTKLFGFGIFKGDTVNLIHDVRTKSANLNPHSVKYNPEYLYINYFSPDINASFQEEYYIKRSLPLFLVNKLAEAAVAQLPPENSAILQSIYDVSSIENRPSSEQLWEKIKNNPVEKNKLLLETLSKFCACKSSKMKEITEVIELIKKNISLIEQDKENQVKQFSTILATASVWNNQSPLINAINNEHISVIDMFVNEMSSDDLSHSLHYAIQKGKLEAVRLILEKIDIQKEDIDITGLALNGEFSMVKLLKDYGVQPKNESTFNDALSLGMIKVANNNDVYAIKKALSDFPMIDLNKENEKKEAFEKTLKDSFILAIQKRLNKYLLDLQEIFPDYFNKFIQMPEVLTAAVDAGSINVGSKNVLNLLIKNSNFTEEKINALIKECTINNLLYLIKTEQYEEIRETLQKYPYLIEELNENNNNLQSELFDIYINSIKKENIQALEKIKQNFPDSYDMFLENDEVFFIALKENKELSVKFLLEEKVNPNIKNDDNQTPLLNAVSFLNTKMIKILKNYVNDPSIEYYLNLEATMLSLVNQSKFDEIKSLCDKYKIDITNTRTTLYEKLWEAASLSSNNARQILDLFPNSGLLDKQGGNSQDTLLLIFARENSVEGVQLLLERNANIDLINNLEQSPLEVAILNKNIQIASLLTSPENRKTICAELIVNCITSQGFEKIDGVKKYFLAETNQLFEEEGLDLLSMAVKETNFDIAFKKVHYLVKNGIDINLLNLEEIKPETEEEAQEFIKIEKMKSLLPLEEKDLNHITQRHLALKLIYEKIPDDNFDEAVDNFKELDQLLIELNSFPKIKEIEDLIPIFYEEFIKNPDQIQQIKQNLLDELTQIKDKLPESKHNDNKFFKQPTFKKNLTHLINKIESEIPKNLLNQRYS
ncbi:MAG: ankyrin repeat domain-containing protein [Gammaproteobacteria bacterium]|nr:ankyrin repeat domain-containing protein [Gammaproteobacteria bacterium]